MLQCFVCLCLLAVTVTLAVHNIVNYGAVPGNNSYSVSVNNGVAFFDAVTVANADPKDRTVLIPANFTFSILPHSDFSALFNLTVQLDGDLSAFAGDIFLWPNNTATGHALDLLQVSQSSDITLRGSGKIIGNGYPWWWYVVLSGHDNRPHLLNIIQTKGLRLEGWTLTNSPQYHVRINDCMNVLVQFVTVHVDVEEQKQLLDSFGLLSQKFEPHKKVGAGLPIFPLNTDGIDVGGNNITVRFCRVENFDDSVCIKPSNQHDQMGNCSENMMIHDIDIHFGVGASVGSVPPNVKVNCIRNITFNRINFTNPIKAIYVKPNPCPNPETDGTGIIDQITYSNIYATSPLTWPIWVSTQQQEQPGNGTDTHCSFFYPLPNTTCPTQPCVPVTRLTIVNYTAVGGLIAPGVLRCNEKGPCRDWLFENVNITTTGFPFGQHFLCQAIVNFTMINTNPSDCIYNVSEYIN